MLLAFLLASLILQTAASTLDIQKGAPEQEFSRQTETKQQETAAVNKKSCSDQGLQTSIPYSSGQLFDNMTPNLMMTYKRSMRVLTSKVHKCGT